MNRQSKGTLAAGAGLLGLVVGALLVALSLASVAAPAPGPAAPPAIVRADRTTLGDPAAKVKILIYFDPLCSHCLNVYYQVEGELIRRYVQTGKAHLELRPLAFLAPESVKAGKALLAAADQGRFWDYHSALWDAYRRGGVPAYSDANLKALATRLGLRADLFNAAYDGPAKANELKQITDQATAEGIRSVPLTVINGQRLEGEAPLERFVQLIEAELAK